MKKIGVIVNNRKDSGFVHFKHVTELLLKAGYSPVVTNEYRSILPDDSCEKTTLEGMFKKTSLVITLGGDGTLLNVADLAVRYDVALLGVNLGTLGYLAQLDKSEIDRIPEILDSEMTFQNRMMMLASVIRGGKTVYKYSALNDIVVTRSAVLKPIYINLLGDTGTIAEYFCDGLIFSTPTGSSAYSLSVGGPIMDPSMEAILVSAISPHSLSSHSLVFNPEKSLECRTRTDKSLSTLICADGRHVFYLESNDRIFIKKNNKYLKILQLSDSDFYTVLRGKFSSRGGRL